jgi:hypothetical protein
MRLVTWLTVGFVLWIVIWAISGKGFDALLVFIAVLAAAATYEIVSRYLPDRE